MTAIAKILAKQIAKLLKIFAKLCRATQKRTSQIESSRFFCSKCTDDEVCTTKIDENAGREVTTPGAVTTGLPGLSTIITGEAGGVFFR